MRSLVAITLFVTLFESCSDTGVRNTEDANDSLLSDSSKYNTVSNFVEAKLTEMIVTDISGDGVEDRINFIPSGPSQGKIGIKLGDDSIQYIMKFESVDGALVDDFSWADCWGLLQDSIVTVTYAVDGELRDSVFTLENPAIKLWQDGGGSGFFTFKGGKWIWVTTGC